ncbi:lysine/arginine/ornithine ABC transporter substrate-binding protein [Ensifer sp. P24N7]|uniref:lysine/arginine/ornithine ABC transporter substrate-binding protein n=1 Tax=Sinorhizobium sp. P24N7 TaxID=3348358 RepID=UPI0035F35871
MNTFKMSAVLAMLASAAVIAGQAFAQDPKSITIATDATYAPFEFKDAGGNLVGFDIDLANDLCKRMEIKCAFMEQAWDGIIPSLVSGRFDAIVSSMDILPDREKVISFAGPYLETPYRFVTVSGSPLLDIKSKLESITLDEISAEEKSDLKELAGAFEGKKFGVVVNSTTEFFMRDAMPGVELATYDSADQMILDLSSGRIDASISSFGFLKPLTDKPEGRDLKIFGPGLTGGAFGKGTGIGLRKDEDALRASLNKAIGEATADGTIRNLSMKWFGYDASPKQ